MAHPSTAALSVKAHTLGGGGRAGTRFCWLYARSHSVPPTARCRACHFIVLILVVHVPRGYSMTVNGVEFPLMWLMMLIAIALRGGGPYSIDRRIGKEI